MYDIFGKFGAIRQIRLGNAQDTRGTAFVVYEDIYDAKTAVDHLSGFNVCGRYLVVLYYQQTKMQKQIHEFIEANTYWGSQYEKFTILLILVNVVTFSLGTVRSRFFKSIE